MHCQPKKNKPGSPPTSDSLKSLNGLRQITNRHLDHISERVYNIEVDGDHVYRVGQSGLLVHNVSLKKLDCAVFKIPNGKLYRGLSRSGVTQLLSFTAERFGIEQARKDVAADEADPDRKKRIFAQHAVRGNSEYVSATAADKRVAFVFATDQNRRDGYIYVIDKARAEKNTENSKKTQLPGDKIIQP